MSSLPVKLIHGRWLFHRFPSIAHRLLSTKASSSMKDSANGPSETLSIVREVLGLQRSNVSSWIVENKVKGFCQSYKCMDVVEKRGTLRDLALNFAVDHGKIVKVADQIRDFEGDEVALVKKSEQLKASLRPQYNWLFLLIGRTEDGVKFLIDLRTDVMDLLKDSAPSSSVQAALQQLNLSLKELLSLWFTVGFLHLERITWKSSCEMLEKISEYEAVHKIRNWPDLKRRVGPYRRCYVYTHAAMPREPLIVLHTALSDVILDSVRGLVGGEPEVLEDPDSVKAAVFYSISSTQRGLQGIELGNYLIRRVAREVQAEFPSITQFSTLSPIPTFKSWLMEKMKVMEKSDSAPQQLWAPAFKAVGSWGEIRQSLHRNAWLHDEEMESLLKAPLMASCAYYLFREKRRGSALDSVANFHLKNGAVMWRLNWMADTSGRGMANSCGMMVNYRYYLPQTEANSREYLESKVIKATDQVLELCSQASLPAKL